MDDNYSPALTDHRLRVIEWREENEKIGGILSPTAAFLPLKKYKKEKAPAIIDASLTNR